MPRLTATFTLPLSSTILLRGEQPRTYSVAVDGFDVVLTIPVVDGARSKTKNERLWTYMSEQLTVSVSRDEAEPPPPLGTTPRAGRDFTTRVPYFNERCGGAVP